MIKIYNNKGEQNHLIYDVYQDEKRDFVYMVLMQPYRLVFFFHFAIYFVCVQLCVCAHIYEKIHMDDKSIVEW